MTQKFKTKTKQNHTSIFKFSAISYICGLQKNILNIHTHIHFIHNFVYRYGKKDMLTHLFILAFFLECSILLAFVSQQKEVIIGNSI